MNESIGILVNKIARKFGLEIHRYTPEVSDAARLQALLAFHGIDLILDVGANIGQFARSVRAGGYNGKIVSFEPLSGAYKDLIRSSQNDPDWFIAPRAAIGSVDGNAEINISENSVSSSVLPMKEAHLNAAPASRYIGTERVELARLDTIALQYIDGSASLYLKIDTQGFEAEVLDGAAILLPKIKGIQVELSLVSMYEGQILFMEMIRKLNGLGYELHGIMPAFTEPKTGRLLQIDGIFFREKSI